MKSLSEQYVNFWFALNELPSSSEDTREAYALFGAAHSQLEAECRTIPGRVRQIREGQDTFEDERYELCAADGCAEDRNGVFAWSICIHATEDLPNEVLVEFKALAERVFTEQAAKVGGSARFVGADKYNVYRVTETVPVQL